METLLSFPALREALTTVNSPVYGSVLASAMKFNDQDPETVRLGASIKLLRRTARRSTMSRRSPMARLGS